MRLDFTLFVLLMCFGLGLIGQELPNMLERKIDEQTQDTLLVMHLDQVEVDAANTADKNLTWRERRSIKKKRKLVYNIQKTMPYAKLCAEYLSAIDDSMQNIQGERARKKFYKKAEAHLKEQFEGKLKKLTYSQGKLLIKFIDRETGNTTYELLKDYKSDFSAAFWNTFAGIFGMSLKKNYDPEGEDKELEELVIYLGY